MYKHSTLSNIIYVIVLNLEVVDCNRCFENLVLNLFHNDVFTVYKNEDVPGSQVNRICPTLYGRVEAGHRGRFYVLLCFKHNNTENRPLCQSSSRDKETTEPSPCPDRPLCLCGIILSH